MENDNTFVRISNAEIYRLLLDVQRTSELTNAEVHELRSQATTRDQEIIGVKQRLTRIEWTVKTVLAGLVSALTAGGFYLLKAGG